MLLHRDLRFTNLDEVLEEVDRLDSSGVQTVGKWSYYQILDHIASALEHSMTAYPRRLPALVRKAIGPLAFRHMLKNGFMKVGGPNPDAPKEREEGDAGAALRRLKGAITKFKIHGGTMAEHPFFGTLSKEDFQTLHSYHAALHLGFAHPEESVVKVAAGFVPSERSGRSVLKKQAAGSRASGSSHKTTTSGAKKSAAKKSKKTAAPTKKAAGKKAKKTPRRG